MLAGVALRDGHRRARGLHALILPSATSLLPQVDNVTHVSCMDGARGARGI